MKILIKYKDGVHKISSITPHGKTSNGIPLFMQRFWTPHHYPNVPILPLVFVEFQEFDVKRQLLVYVESTYKKSEDNNLFHLG